MIVARGSLKTLEEKKVHLNLFLEHFVITLDEHDEATPFKNLPIDDEPYLLTIANCWLENQRLVVAKARQMTITWLFCSCMLWDAMFLKGRLNVIISKKKEDANALVDRCKFIYRKLPKTMQNAIKAKRSPQGEIGSMCRLEFEDYNCLVEGLSSESEDIRRRTVSNIFFDEMAFMEGAEKAYIAISPALEGGGKFIGVSTPNGRNFFYHLWNGFESER